jgi:trehalose synthase
MTAPAHGPQEIPLAPFPLGRLWPVVTEDGRRALQLALADGREALRGRTVWMVNSTPVGGGVAELLRTLTPYWLDAGIDAHWAVVGGGPAFFRITKRIHNLLHGYPSDDGQLGSPEQRVYERALEPARVWLERRLRVGDVVVLHDPQTAGLAPALKAAGAHVVCRSHVGAEPGDALAGATRDFLRTYAASADAIVLTRRSDPLPQLGAPRIVVIPPCIDPCSPKNRSMPLADARRLLTEAGLVAAGRRSGTPVVGTIRSTGRSSQPGTAPLVVHLARWDRLKDPLGVMEAFATVLDRADARLILAGPAVHAVADDPEAAAVYDEVEQQWERLPRAERDRIDLLQFSLRDPHANAVIVNALQREATVVVKKSLQEGFGLGVAEAMWKRRPVVASDVGGHRVQIEHGVSGVLVPDARNLPRFGRAIADLLADPERRRRLGEAAHEQVRTRFLPDRHIAAWMRLLAELGR